MPPFLANIPYALAASTAILDNSDINYSYLNCVCDANTVNVAEPVLTIVYE